MSKNKTKGGIIKFSVCISLFIFLLFFGIKYIANLHGYTFKTIETISTDNNLSAIINNIISYVGILLGLFYFIFRIIIENVKEDKISKHSTYRYVDTIIDECHEIMENLFHKKIKQSDLKNVIDNLNSKSILIQNYIEINDKKLDKKFYNSTSPYASWNSFITTCTIVNSSPNQYKNENFMVERDQYLEYYRLVKCSIYSFL